MCARFHKYFFKEDPSMFTNLNIWETLFETPKVHELWNAKHAHIERKKKRFNWLRPNRVNQHPPTHHVGWMVCGHETFFHYINVP